MRKAFSMLTAIVLIVLMAGLAAMVTNLSGKIIKETTTQYRHEQAALLAQSYTEYAILAIQGHGRPTTAPVHTCLRTITANVGTTADTKNGNSYRIEVKIQYIGLRPIADGICGTTAPSISGKRSFGYQTANLVSDTTSNDISAMIDVYVEYHDLETISAMLTAGITPTNTNTPWITYHRRTLQKL